MIHDTEPLKKRQRKSLEPRSLRKEGNESDGNPHRDVSRNVRSHDKIVDARLISSWTPHPEGVESGFIANRGADGHVVSLQRIERERERARGTLVSCSLERKICRSLLNETG